MKILSSFIHPQFVPKLHELISSVDNKKYILKKVGNQTVNGSY